MKTQNLKGISQLNYSTAIFLMKYKSNSLQYHYFSLDFSTINHSNNIFMVEYYFQFLCFPLEL